MADAQGRWPGGKRFSFTVCDDADNGTLALLAPVYGFLDELGLRTTKTVWVFPPDLSRGFTGDTLEDAPYLEFVRRLRDRGFEIALHGVRSGDSPREMVLDGLRKFEGALGFPPRIHVNHAGNRDNVHWGDAWNPPWRRLFRRSRGRVFEGDLPGSPYYWGDVCRERIRYVRGRIFRGINTLRFDPWMPYHEPRFPCVRAWFSSSDGADVRKFRSLISEENQDRLEAEGGCCIVYTHFAKGFVDPAGRVDAEVERLLRCLAARPGWFAPVGTVLDHLSGGRERTLTPLQKFRLDWNVRLDSRGMLR